MCWCVVGVFFSALKPRKVLYFPPIYLSFISSLSPASHTYHKHMKLCAFHAWLTNTPWLSDFRKVCVRAACVCARTYNQRCQFSDEKSARSAVFPFAQKRENTLHTVGVPRSSLPPPAFLQVAFAKVVLLISNIFDFQCETHCLRPPKRHESGDVWLGQNYSEESRECGRRVTPPRGAQRASGG